MILERILSPRDLKQLEPEQLPDLAREIREEIVSVCSKTGGHLSSSLGATDIAVALHYVFPESENRIIWDTGHQAYAHKLLTGRLDRFDTLRQKGGLSGFLKRDESPYDHFGAGHACTALSAALGFSAGDRIRGKDCLTIAVLGDGAATGGMVYEAINNAKLHGGRLLVVLNDNEMSISPNVGAITNVLTRLTSTRTFLRVEGGTWNFLGLVPWIGRHLRSMARRSKQGLKHLVLPSNFFEDFGFKYFGPIDGHDLPSMVKTLRQLRQIKEPVFLHVFTTKGKGYKFAEKDPTKYHGFAPFDPATGIKKSPGGGPKSYTEVFGEALVEIAEKDERVTAITAAMAPGTGLEEFSKRFPERYFDVGIAEGHAVTFAAGLAADGLRPVVAVYSTFMQRAFDMILHDVALQRLPVTFALDRAGLVGEDGPTHHGTLDLSYMSMVPGMLMMAPSDENELRRMLATALSYEIGPSSIRYPRAAGLGLTELSPLEALEVGRSRLLADGEDVAIWAIGSMVGPARKAAEMLAAEGIHPRVVDARFVQPLDGEALSRDLKSSRLLVTVEENSSRGGFGEGVASYCREEGITVPQHLLLSLPSRFVEQGPRDQLLKELGLDAEGIAESVRRVLGRRSYLAVSPGGRNK